MARITMLRDSGSLRRLVDSRLVELSELGALEGDQAKAVGVNIRGRLACTEKAGKGWDSERVKRYAEIPHLRVELMARRVTI